jgi:hypothetical protein
MRTKKASMPDLTKESITSAANNSVAPNDLQMARND